MTIESRVEAWVISRFGDAAMQPKERAMRLLEETIELAQAEGITDDQVLKLYLNVYTRPVGKVVKEAADVAFCLAAWCRSSPWESQFSWLTMNGLAEDALDRNEAKPIEHTRASLERKAAAGLTFAEAPCPTCNDTRERPCVTPECGPHTCDQCHPIVGMLARMTKGGDAEDAAATLDALIDKAREVKR